MKKNKSKDEHCFTKQKKIQINTKPESEPKKEKIKIILSSKKKPVYNDKQRFEKRF